MLDLFLPRLSQYLLITSGAIIWGVCYVLYRNYCTIHETASFETRALHKADPYVDRRSSRRIRSQAVLGLKVESGKGATGTATLHDMSKTGACFDSRVLLKPKQKLQTRIHTRNHDSILEFSAQVVWIKSGESSHRYGVQFLPI